MRDTPLRMSAGEANFALALVGMPLNEKKMIVVVQLNYEQRLRSQFFITEQCKAIVMSLKISFLVHARSVNPLFH